MAWTFDLFCSLRVTLNTSDCGVLKKYHAFFMRVSKQFEVQITNANQLFFNIYDYMKRILFFAAIAAICFVSCNKNEVFTENDRRTASGIELLNEVFSADREADMLRPFARALYNAMSESPMLRELIRTRALEKFNREYDVLYQFIKDEPVENGLTVRQLLLTHFESEEALAYIERNRPTLTIFVPQLPEGSFSAQLWNTEEEVPFVALHVTRHIHTPIIGNFGEYGDEFLMELGLIPGFPVVVLRNNARVRVVEGAPRTRSAALDNPNSDFVFEFTDPYFDGSKADKSISTRQSTTTVLDATLQRAFQIFPNDAVGWQRDYIYYGITPTNPIGRLSRNFKEYITSFRFVPYNSTPQHIFNMITNLNDSSDPRWYSYTRNGRLVYAVWTDTRYTFRVRMQTGSTGHLEQREELFCAHPTQLFDVIFTLQPLPIRVPIFGTLHAYQPFFRGFRTMDLRIPLIHWDLAQFEPTMNITIARKRDGRTITDTVSREHQFAGNVTWDIKNGPRFGGTDTRRTVITSQIVRKIDDVHLGHAFVNFGDMVVLGQQGNTWRLREHHSSMFAITVQPRRVQ